MAQVAVETLNDQIDDWIQRVRRGERIVLTSKDRPFAVLSPLDEDESQEAWRLVEAGVARWSGRKLKPPADPPKIKGRPTSEIVLEDRQ